MPLSLPAGTRFRVVRWREGYDVAQVDTFVAQADSGAVSPEMAKDVRFTPTRLRPGYDMGEVDDYLDGLIHKHRVVAGPSRRRWRGTRLFRSVRPWNQKNRKGNLIGNIAVALFLVGLSFYFYFDGTARTNHAHGQVMPASTCEVVFATADGRRIDWVGPTRRGNSACADPIGATVTIWYDPNDPMNASLEARSGLWVDLLFGLSGAGLIVVYSLVRWRMAGRSNDAFA